MTININCTPKEARVFFGLPDFKPMQDTMISEPEKGMRASMDTMDTETRFKTWLPTRPQSWEHLQKALGVK